jgi:hypothetical protein
MRTDAIFPLFFALLLLAPSQVFPAEQPRTPERDPADALEESLLQVDDTALHALLDALATDDFDQRSHAERQLARMGPAFLARREALLKNAAGRVQTHLLNAELKVLTEYDGYLPTSDALNAAMEEKLNFDPPQPVRESLLRFAKDHGFRALLGPELPPVPFNELRLPEASRLAHLCVAYANRQTMLVPRGDTLVAMSLERATALREQRHTFDWSELQLSRDEALRMADLLRRFYPQECALNAASATLTVRGEEHAIARTARLVALLTPGAHAAIWPRTTARLADAVERLSAPANLALNAEDPFDALAMLRKDGHTIATVDPRADTSLAARRIATFEEHLRGAAPVRLRLKNQPLGFVLHWLEKRTRFPNEEQSDFRLIYDLSNDGGIQLRVGSKSRDPLEYALLGDDAGFLYPAGARADATGDAATQKILMDALAPRLELFPTLDVERDVLVVRGRLLMQAPPPTLLYVQAFLEEWRKNGAPPPAPAWREAMTKKLDTPLKWDGRAMTGGRLLPTLRAMGGIDLLLEDAEDGTAARFELSREDAQLLAPGDHTLRALLDELARRTHAAWNVDAGVVVLQPTPRDAPEKQ